MAPLSMFEEVNTGNNLPVQFDIMAAPGDDHADELHLAVRRQGRRLARTRRSCSRKPAPRCRPEKLPGVIETRIKTLGTAACPPYHLAIAIGGTSAELNLKTVKLASTRWLDTLPPAAAVPGTPSATSRWSRRCWR